MKVAVGQYRQFARQIIKVVRSCSVVFFAGIWVQEAVANDMMREQLMREGSAFHHRDDVKMEPRNKIWNKIKQQLAIKNKQLDDSETIVLGVDKLDSENWEVKSFMSFDVKQQKYYDMLALENDKTNDDNLDKTSLFLGLKLEYWFD